MESGGRNGWRHVFFSSGISDLVNGSPISDFRAEMSLRKGDTLSPFLFTMVLEGLDGLINRVDNIREFVGFKLNDNIYDYAIF